MNNDEPEFADGGFDKRFTAVYQSHRCQ